MHVTSFHLAAPRSAGLLAAPLLCSRVISPSRRTRPVQAVASPGSEDPVVSEAQVYVSVDPTPPPAVPTATAASTPWYVIAGTGFLALFVVMRTIGAMARRRKRALAARGNPAEEQYKRAMRGLKKMQYEDLTPEQVEAARWRRRQEISRDGGPINLDSIELPENHPFAVKQEVTEEEEEAQRMRLSARRGLSSEDMKLLRQQQELAAQMDAAEEEREKARAARRQQLEQQ